MENTTIEPQNMSNEEKRKKLLVIVVFIIILIGLVFILKKREPTLTNEQKANIINQLTESAEKAPPLSTQDKEKLLKQRSTQP